MPTWPDCFSLYLLLQPTVAGQCAIHDMAMVKLASCASADILLNVLWM